ncbi:winged helix-turn-helix domain-containing protein [Streptomyces sp. NPDC048717]|uniref:helix-turn-helix domain-containing protein n=1 Tax=Streptomyces sp. NPDC048717 TaxID=3154928 RepID=UPI003436DBDB
MRGNDGRKIDRRTLEAIRLRAVQQVESGVRVEEVAAALGFSRAAVFAWVAKYRSEGEQSLHRRPAPGRAPILGARQLTELARLVVGGQPRQYGLDGALWTRETVGSLAADAFGVALSTAALGRALDRLGLAPRHPLHQAPDADAEWLAAWRRDRLPELRAESARRGAVCYLVGGGSVLGAEPVTLISAVTGRAGLRFAALPGAPGLRLAQEFSARLLSDAGGPVTMLVHGELAPLFSWAAALEPQNPLWVVTTHPVVEPEPCPAAGRNSATRWRHRGAVQAPGLPATRFIRCQAAARPVLTAEGGRRRPLPNI